MWEQPRVALRIFCAQAGLFRVSDEVEDEGLDMSKHGGAAYEIDVRARRPPFNVPQRECQLMCRACGPTPTPTQLHLRHACGTLARERARAGGDAPLTAVFKLLTGLQAEDGRRGRSSDCQDGLEPSRRSACDQSDPPPFAVHVTATTPRPPRPSCKAFPSAAHACI